MGSNLSNVKSKQLSKCDARTRQFIVKVLQILHITRIWFGYFCTIEAYIVQKHHDSNDVRWILWFKLHVKMHSHQCAWQNFLTLQNKKIFDIGCFFHESDSPPFVMAIFIVLHDIDRLNVIMINITHIKWHMLLLNDQMFLDAVVR